MPARLIIRRGFVCITLLACALHATWAQSQVTTRDLSRIQADDASRPWLTLNSGGHSATVQSLAFSPNGERLYSGGLDRVVNVWNVATSLRDLQRVYPLEQALRWQVGRGLRGAIYTLAVAEDGLLAVAGYGASPALGEIVIIDPTRNRLVKSLSGHEQAVSSLAFSQDGRWLVSLDLEGRAIRWSRANWESTVLVEADRVTYGAANAAAIQNRPKRRPLTIIKTGEQEQVVLPEFLGVVVQAELQWRLRRYSLSDGKRGELIGPPHHGVVSALAASGDGKYLASSDGVGRLFLSETQPGNNSTTLATETKSNQVTALAWSHDVKTLVAGSSNSTGGGDLQVWDVATKVRRSRRQTAQPVTACSVSRDGRYVACSGGEHHAVQIAKLAEIESPATLAGQSRRIVRAAFAKAPGYQIGFSTKSFEATSPGPRFNHFGPIERTFDPVKVELSGERATPSDWPQITERVGLWSAQMTDRGLQIRYQDQPLGLLPLSPAWDGAERCYCWLTNEQGEAVAIAVGTDVQNSIYLFGLPDPRTIGKSRDGLPPPPVVFPLWRQFRGHHDLVTSVDISPDRKYLLSSSVDGTIRFWSLAESASPQPIAQHWGVEFQTDDSAQPPHLKVKRIHAASPLYFSGVRVGDILRQIEWSDGAEQRRLDEPAKILARLAQVERDAQLDFKFAREGETLPTFPRLPAWQPLATLFVSAQDEWAFYTPEGYYDASINGHTLFGWQRNRGLTELPEFFRADQFRRRLERPDVLEQLLKSGSLAEAYQLALSAPAPRGDRAVAAEIAAAPRIEILSPLAGQTLSGAKAVVRARIEFNSARQLVAPRAYANGVIASQPQIVEREPVVADSNGSERQRVTYEWQAALPADRRNLIQIVAQTDEQALGMNSVVVEQTLVGQPKLGKLYLLTVGVNKYRDPAVQPLAYSVADAQAITQLFELRSRSLYQLQPAVSLFNERVTPSQWRTTFAEVREHLKQVSPDDLLVIFLAGHGFIDPLSGRYYFAGHDISRDDFLRGSFSSSIAWDDFQLLADVPCRKLALVDTCHSGAFQPLRGKDLKSAIRGLQQDLLLTITASAGHEKSEERAEWKHGAFTKSLLEGLSGSADVSLDGIVSLPELIDYVQREVPRLTSGRQNPTAGPSELLPYVSLRLSQPGVATPAASPTGGR